MPQNKPVGASSPLFEQRDGFSRQRIQVVTLGGDVVADVADHFWSPKPGEVVGNACSRLLGIAAARDIGGDLVDHFNQVVDLRMVHGITALFDTG
jgi:hypothetical protein